MLIDWLIDASVTCKDHPHTYYYYYYCHYCYHYCNCWQVGKVKKTKEDKPSEEGVGMNVKSIVVVALMMILMLFAVHCTWVTSNAYSSPSIVLASYGHDGYVQPVYFILYCWFVWETKNRTTTVNRDENQIRIKSWLVQLASHDVQKQITLPGFVSSVLRTRGTWIWWNDAKCHFVKNCFTNDDNTKHSGQCCGAVILTSKVASVYSVNYV